MLSFFRKIRRSLIDSHQMRTYLFYALGEIALVVIGILIALQINNWNEGRKERSTERASLKEIQIALTSDLKTLTINQEVAQRNVGRLDRILHYLQYETRYPDSLLTDFGAVSRGRSFTYNQSALRSLEAKGVDIIRNAELRHSILDLYTDSYGLIIGGLSNFNSNLDLSIRPLLKTRFIYPEDRSFSFVPVNFVSLKSDLEFQNAVKVARSNQYSLGERYDNAIIEVERIIGAINKEVGDGS